MKSFNRKMTAYTVALTALGLSVLMLGLLTNRDYLIAVGASLLAAGISLFFPAHASGETMRRISEIVQEGQSPGLTTPEGHLEGLRRKLHFYHVTIEKGRSYWVHSPLDFQRSIVPGKAVLCLEVKGVRYRFEAGCVNPRLVCIVSPIDPTHHEPCAIFVVPYFNQMSTDEGIEPGIMWHKTWDKQFTEGMGRVLVSDAPIEGCEREGVLTDGEGERLNALWEEDCAARYFMLPKSGVDMKEVFGPVLTGEQRPAQSYPGQVHSE